ncbi:MAG: PKD domain-containing protein [Cyclobacteriaceae bacterium]
MRFIKSIFSTILIIGLIIISSCSDDEQSEDQLTADFSATVNNGTIVTFINSSENATSFAWEFGDGNTSTEESPVHTYSASGTYTVKLTATANGESEFISKAVEVSSLYHESGYFVVSNVITSAAGGVFGQYFPEIPEGDVDLTQGTAYQVFFMRDQLNEFLYGNPLDGSAGIAKLAVSKETNQLVEVGKLTTIDFVGSVTIINENLGFYSGFNFESIFVFNPTTMLTIKEIDMSGATKFPGNEETNFANMIYNSVTGKLLVTVYTDIEATPQFYDADKTYIEVVDVATQTWEKEIVLENAEYTIFRGNQNTVIDEAGNTYFISQGQYGLDGGVGPSAPAGSRPQLIRVNSNSEFDKDYSFNPVDALGLQNNFIQLFTGMVYAGNNKAYGVATAGPESQEIVALLIKFSAGTMTDEEFTELRDLVFNDDAQVIVEIDLISKAVSFVPNMPLTAGFGFPFMFNYDGEIFLNFFSPDAGFNGYYQIDPSTSEATRLYNVTAGGISHQLIDLSINNK